MIKRAYYPKYELINQIKKIEYKNEICIINKNNLHTNNKKYDCSIFFINQIEDINSFF